MAENNNNKAKELVSVSAILFETDSEGLEKENRDLRIGDGVHKFTLTFPIPTDDDEAQLFYNCTIKDLIRKGCRQRTYDCDTDAGNMIAEQVKNGADPMDFLDDVVKEMETSLSTSKPKRESEQKVLKEGKARLKMTTAEMIEMAEKALAAGL